MVVHCCDCGGLVSDTANTCPFCGFDMRLPMNSEQKKQVALQKMRQSQGWVIVSIVVIVITAAFSAELIRSAHVLKATQRAAALKPDDPRPEEIAFSESNYQTTVTLAVLFGIGDIAFLTWAIRRYRWHKYLYNKEFGRSGRRVSYATALPETSPQSGDS